MSHIASDRMIFDGEVLNLDGHVRLKHPFGLLQADSARLKKDLSSKNLIFHRAILKNDVKLILKNNAELTCDLARIDFNTLLGDLTSIYRFVNYQDHINVKGHLHPLKLRARSMNFKMSKHDMHFDIDRLSAIGDVVAVYFEPETSSCREFIIFADRASYQKLNPIRIDRQKIPDGMIRLYQQNNPCHFESEKLNLTAQSIAFDTKRRTVQFIHVNGSLFQGDAPLHFSSERMLYRMDKELLHLQKNVDIQSTIFGHLHAEQSVELTKKREGEIRDISYIKTEGEVHYRVLDHSFDCSGETILNRINQTFTANSPLDSEDQTRYRNTDFTIYSDHLKVYFNELNQQIDRIELMGSVFVVLDQSDSPLQMASCHQLTFYPQSHLLQLAAKPSEKVLLWNQKDSIHLAADELSVIYDPVTKEKAFRSIGDVRCFLTKNEQKLILEHLWKKKNPS
ncbi:MAG: hypothetical protein K9M07_01860 [Simkaniaceae bacterium]|nr:hypothetical protein [Simkaniaceae bacterium]